MFSLLLFSRIIASIACAKKCLWCCLACRESIFLSQSQPQLDRGWCGPPKLPAQNSAQSRIMDHSISRRPSTPHDHNIIATMSSKPSFSFGLKKSLTTKPLPPKRKPATFGDNDSSDEDFSKPGAKAMTISELDFDTPLEEPTSSKPAKFKISRRAPSPPSKPPPVTKQSNTANPFGDLSSALTSKKHAAAAAETDPSIYDYDSVYDSLKAASRLKAEAAKEDGRPRYFDALQKAAEQRERDRQIAEEKRLKRERDAEGDEFADKEKFVTEAYKRQQAENRRLEEEEKKKEEQERRRGKDRGMADFYKKMLEVGEEEHRRVVKAVEEGVKVEVDAEEEKTLEERAREINAMGGNVEINEDGEVVDKRQLLKGGLNLGVKKMAEVERERKKREESTRTQAVRSQGVFNVQGGKNALRERQTRMLEAQLEETLKRSREEEEKERAKVELIAKSRKTEADISSAKERYLARKRAAEEAKKKEQAEG